MKTNVLGVQYDNVTMAEALDTARALLQRPEASYCVTPNAEMAYEALRFQSTLTQWFCRYIQIYLCSHL